MPRKDDPFPRNKKFNGKNYSFHSTARNKRLAEEKVKTLRNKGLSARYAPKTILGDKVYGVYEARKKR